MAAAEPHGWEESGSKTDKGHTEKPAWGRPLGKRPAAVVRKTSKVIGVANVVTTKLTPEERKCKFREYTGCAEGHVAASCIRLRDLDSEARQKALDESGLCTFCLRHPTGTECFGQGSCSKPACQVPECKEKHTESLHEIVAGLNASISLMAEEEDKEEEDAYVNVAWAGEWEEEESGWWDPADSWLEMEAEEEDEDGVFYVNAFTGKEEDGEGEEVGKVNATRAEGQEEGERGGWWTSDQS